MHKLQRKKPDERKLPGKAKNMDHVSGILYTGMTNHKVKQVSNSEYIRRRNEVHYRITKGQLVDLYTEYESYESIRDADRGSGDHGPRIVTHDSEDTPVYEKPYLIIDGRPREDYDHGHLAQARSFPANFLRRDMTPPDFQSFRNKPSTLIIVYCDDERTSLEMAQTFVGRGTENIYVLTGGLFDLAVDYPHFIEGKLPLNLPMPKAIGGTFNAGRPMHGSRTGAGSGGGGGETRLTRAALDRIEEEAGMGSYGPGRGHGSPSRRLAPTSSFSSRGSPLRPPLSYRRGHSSPGSETGRSVQSDRSVADSIISRASARRGRF
jgi:rhodanese-related sulfurtransferase